MDSGESHRDIFCAGRNCSNCLSRVLYLGLKSAVISTYWWSITAIAIYIGAFTYGEVYNREARRLSRDTRIALEKHREVLKKNLEPSVEVLTIPRRCYEGCWRATC